MPILRNLSITGSILITCLAPWISSCTHLKYASVQADYARIQNAQPAQLNAKHMIERETFFVHGRCADADYTPLAAYLIRTNGKYLMALSDGTLTPFLPEQDRSVKLVRGRRPPENQVEKHWMRFMEEHPELRNRP